jgi:prolyl 4-hydroxylase
LSGAGAAGHQEAVDSAREGSGAKVEYRVQIGQWVAHRLGQHPRAMKIPSATLDIFVVRDFLSAKECEAMVRLIDADRIPSQLLAPTEDPDFRTSESCNLDPTNPAVRQIEGKVIELMGIDPRQGETIQGQRYAVGQQFKPHHDFFYEGEAYWEQMVATGGQRTWTAMAFLNAPEEGGHTFFPEANIKVKPRAGNLLVWNNLDANGHPNPASLHTGMPVLAGTKYVLTKWFREGIWHNAPVPTYSSVKA